MHHREVACGLCGKLCIAGNVFALSPKDSVYYCSEGCITRDYPVHQKEVSVLERLEKLDIRSGDGPCRLLTRMASIRSTERHTGEGESACSESLLPALGK